uniref:Uncharacterized protein n=1 Tax=Rhizophora mucronata TaxID=61149 RepID=A0A2P2PE52_RHIMU
MHWKGNSYIMFFIVVYQKNEVHICLN